MKILFKKLPPFFIIIIFLSGVLLYNCSDDDDEENISFKFLCTTVNFSGNYVIDDGVSVTIDGTNLENTTDIYYYENTVVMNEKLDISITIDQTTDNVSTTTDDTASLTFKIYRDGEKIDDDFNWSIGTHSVNASDRTVTIPYPYILTTEQIK